MPEVQQVAALSQVDGFFALEAQDPDAIALTDDSTGNVRTRRQVGQRANQIVHALRTQGLRTGSVVGIAMHNQPEFVECFLAAMQGGFYAIPLNPKLTADELTHILTDADADAIVVSGDVVAAAEDAATAAGIDPGARWCTDPGTDWQTLDEALAGVPTSRPEDLTTGWMLQYTSGTTGRPKGVKRPLNGLHPDDPATLTLWRGILDAFDVTGDHVQLVQSPLYHSTPLTMMYAGLQTGQAIVLMEGWDARRVLDVIQRYRVTLTPMVPTQFHRLLQIPADERAGYDTSSLRRVIHGAAPCPVHTKQQIIEWLGPVVMEYYSASEGGGCSVTSEEWLARPGTVGRAYPGAEIEIRDSEGNRVPNGASGLVWINPPPSQKFEYHKDPDKTSASHAGTFFTVGDMGYMDDEGYLFLDGRASEMIITGGVNVYPAEVEAALLRHPDVYDAAVLGLPDEEWGERVVAVVQAREGVDGDGLPAVLREHAGGLLARHKVPRQIEIVETLPRDPNGKLYKLKVRSLLTQS